MVAESLSDFLAREYSYLRGRRGSEFFLAIELYVRALNKKWRIRRALKQLQREMLEASTRYVSQQNEFVAEAKSIREDLAARAPEIDNTEMERPDPGSHAHGEWEYDSFAGFDSLVERDSTLRIGFPAVPHDNDNPGVVTTLLQILRGRLRAAEYGEDASINDPQIRQDLGDLGRRIGNLGRRHEHALTRYRQQARTLPGLAITRLSYFGSDLNPPPAEIETDEDVERWLDKTLRDWGKPKTVVHQLLNGQQMEAWERDRATETEQFLKGELDRLHQELVRRVGGSRGAADLVRRNLREITLLVLASVVAGLILFYVFGVGRADSSSGPTRAQQKAALRNVYDDLAQADAALAAADRSHFWGGALPLPVAQWERNRDVLAATLSRQNWESVAGFYGLAEVANDNPQNFTGENGKSNVRLLRRELRPALLVVKRLLR